MKRRLFLQLAAGAAACAAAEHAFPASASQVSLRISAVLRDSVPGVVVLPGNAPIPAHAASLGISGWLDADEVLHVMIEKPHPLSQPAVVVSSLQPGRRYRMRLMNATGAAVPVKLPGRRVELVRIDQAPVAGLFTNAILLKRYGVAEAQLHLETL